MFGIKKLAEQVYNNEMSNARWLDFFLKSNQSRWEEIVALQKDVKLLRAELASRPVMVSSAELAKLKEQAERNQVNTAALANARHDLLFPNQVTDLPLCPRPPSNKIDIGN